MRTRYDLYTILIKVGIRTLSSSKRISRHREGCHRVGPLTADGKESVVESAEREPEVSVLGVHQAPPKHPSSLGSTFISRIFLAAYELEQPMRSLRNYPMGQTPQARAHDGDISLVAGTAGPRFVLGNAFVHVP